MAHIGNTMFNKRSLLTLASLAAALVAHAGPISVVGSWSGQVAIADGILNYSSASNFAPGYTAVSSSDGVSSAVADNAVFCDGTTLFGYSQAYGSTSVSTGSAGDFNVASEHELYFELTATSTVSFGMAADSGSTATKRGKGTSSSADASGFASLYHYGVNGWEEVASVEDTDLFLSSGTWEAGLYGIVVGGTASGSANAGSKAGSTAYASSYGYGVYSLTAQAVPEPTSVAALAFGAAAMLRRRKKA